MPLAALTTSLLGLGLGLTFAAPAAASPAAPPGGWRWPLAGVPVVSRPFQPPAHPWGAGHRGVDLSAPPGATVLAAGAGVVSFAGYVAGVGVVAVSHPGGLRTTYEPVAPGVVAGAAVVAGDPIGRLLPGHGDCGAGRWCLHWGLLRGSTYLDPLTLVRRGPVRLLPLVGAPQPAAARPYAVAAPPVSGQLTAVLPRAGHAAVPARRAAAAPRSPVRRLAAPAVAAAVTATAALAGWLARRKAGLAVAGLSRAGRRAWL